MTTVIQVIILRIGMDRFEQTVQTQIRLDWSQQDLGSLTLKTGTLRIVTITIFILLHSERSKLYAILAFLSAIVLKLNMKQCIEKLLMDWQTV